MNNAINLSNNDGIKLTYSAATEPRVRKVVGRTLVCNSADEAAGLAGEIRAWGFTAKAWGINVDVAA